MTAKTYPMKVCIRNEGTGPARIDIFDDIGAGGWFSEGFTPASFADAIKGVTGPLDVHINSGGGDVADGIAIASAIRAYPGPKRTVVDGMAASIASVIAQAGDERIVEPGAMLMIHDPLTACMGNQDDFLKVAETLGKHGDNLAQQYADRSGTMSASEWREVMRAETWYTADEAVSAGLADRVGTAGARLPQGADVDMLAARAPARIMAALRSLPRAADGAPAVPGQPCKTCKGRGRLKHPGTGRNGATCPGCGGSGTYSPDGGDGEGAQDRLAAQAGDTPLGSGWVRGADGKVRFDPDGDGDDDSTPEGDTDHDYFAPDGTPKKPVPPCPVSRDALTEERVRAILRDEVARMAAAKADESPWDAAKAWAAGSASDDPAKFFAGICAGEKAEGDPGTQEHWALPYRYSPDSAPNAAAVRNCLARLGQTQGLKDPAAAKAKLHALMKQVNPDWEPEDSTDTSVFSQRLRQMRAALPALKGADA